MDKLAETKNIGAHNLIYPFEVIPEPGKMLKIEDGVYWVRMRLPFVLDHINLWVLSDDGGWTVVDTGVASAEIKENWRQCFSEDMEAKKVKKVI
ncbi:MAG: MBL fold metallo-hydrolase, partial [Pseudomonadota bacterium]|nr:MBL fold metallo-hydrolase [Pseudomonadota bacterium]